MATNMASNAVLAKARALYGRHLTDEDYENLAACRTMPELAGALKTLPLYASSLEEVNTAFARRAQLENCLRKSIYLRYASLCQYDMSAGQTVYRYFVLCSDLDEINTFLRYLDSGNPGDYLYDMPPFLEKHTRLHMAKLAGAHDMDSMLKALADTPYAAAMEPLRGVGPGELMPKAEPILSALRHKALAAIAGKGKKVSGTVPDVQDFVKMESDIATLTQMVRLKRMGMSEMHLRKRFATDCTALSNTQWDALFSARNSAEFQQALDATEYGARLKGTAYTYLGEGFYGLRYKWCLHNLRFSASPTLVMLCYTFLANNEVQNLNHIIEGVHYAMGTDAILPLLVGYQGGDKHTA